MLCALFIRGGGGDGDTIPNSSGAEIIYGPECEKAHTFAHTYNFVCVFGFCCFFRYKRLKTCKMVQ